MFEIRIARAVIRYKGERTDAFKPLCVSAAIIYGGVTVSRSPAKAESVGTGSSGAAGSASSSEAAAKLGTSSGAMSASGGAYMKEELTRVRWSRKRAASRGKEKERRERESRRGVRRGKGQCSRRKGPTPARNVGSDCVVGRQENKAESETAKGGRGENRQEGRARKVEAHQRPTSDERLRRQEGTIRNAEGTRRQTCENSRKSYETAKRGEERGQRREERFSKIRVGGENRYTTLWHHDDKRPRRQGRHPDDQRPRKEWGNSEKRGRARTATQGQGSE
ncbi:hypothetical protein C8F01DRAFT_1091991 [Mycena amicta]|nr:hypothetical protein C8F01DRAFT_1091991 [Mycena amicta]